MGIAAGDQGPEVDRFWRAFEERLLAAAKGICRGCKWQLESGPQDFVQDALMETMKFVGEQIGGGPATLRQFEALSDAAFRHAYVCMRNDFLDQVRLAVTRKHHADMYRPLPGETEGSSCWAGDRAHTPEDYAIALSLAEQMSQASKSRKNKAIARAALRVAEEGGENVNGKDVTGFAGVSSSDLADFRRMVRTRLGIRPG